MARVSRPASVGIDFGTSNTVVAVADGHGHVETICFSHASEMHRVFASALCFWRDGSDLLPRVEGGPWAIARYLEGAGPLRFMQSFKTFAASRAFQSTMIFRQRYAFEDILAAFLRTVARHAGPALDLNAARITIGRPVRFAGGNPDEVLAMQRYRDAFGRLGLEKAAYVYEPVGAAFSFARHIDNEATVLVADFGGGTSDFSVMRFSRRNGALRAEPLGHAGVGIAGDTFDARIIQHVVAPHLGRGGSYRSFGKVLPLPSHYFATLARWNELALMKSGTALRELRELARDALEPEPLHRFIALVENDLGFPLYRAVSAVKAALSAQDAADFHFADAEIDIRARVARHEFEDWIADDLARIAATVDQAMNAARITPQAVDKVFLTGGTSFVPAIQRLFSSRFGADKVVAADQFESIAHGLAHIGQTENPDQWAVSG